MRKCTSRLLAGVAVVWLLGWVAAASAQTVTFNLTLLGANEPDGAGNLGAGDPDGVATGTLALNPVADTVDYNFTYSNISGTAISGFHIHGPATPTQNVGVLIGLPLSSTVVPNGTQIGQVTVANDANLSAKIDQVLANPTMYYLNLHSSGTGGFPGGAVRATLPEPGAMAALAMSSSVLLMRCRRRRR
ncbi:CHRD domain-containing protein [Fontivita pretiosa]|uniref:CHRD domain-containing protein n=1 Tax=Fontivita pretiosa TaxID=2989684 RepID=UPI003D16573E